MKKSALFFTVIGLMVLCSFSPKQISDFAGNKLKGKLKSYIYSHFLVKYDSLDNASLVLFSKESKQFDLAGNILVSRQYNTDGSERAKFEYSYNENGQTVEGKSFNKNGSLMAQYSYVYDKKGNLTEQRVKNFPSGVTYKTVKQYDGRGNMIQEDAYNGAGILTKSFVRKYDRKGHVIWRDFEAGDGIAESYKYDGKGNRTERNRLGADGVVKERHISVYGKTGAKTEETIYNENKQLLRKYTYAYDSHLNLTAENIYDPDSLIGQTIFKYTYDKTGNWLTDSAFENSKFTYLKKQDLEYY